MNRLAATALAVSLFGATSAVFAQSYPEPDGSPRYGSTQSLDYARVIRVDPVFDGYATSGGQRCYERPTYVGGDGDYDGNDAYGRDDGYYEPNRNGADGNGNGTVSGGTQGGRTMATIVGGIVGAAVGSQIGGGNARYATSAIGSMVGGMAGRQIYDENQRQRVGTVRVCDPVRDGDDYYSGGRAVTAYDVTYEYAGRTYTTRTRYDPGDRIRVRVDVRPE